MQNISQPLEMELFELETYINRRRYGFVFWFAIKLDGINQPGLRMFYTRAGTRVNYYRRFTTLDDRIIIGSAKRDTDNSDNDDSKWLRSDTADSRLVGHYPRNFEIRYIRFSTVDSRYDQFESRGTRHKRPRCYPILLRLMQNIGNTLKTPVRNVSTVEDTRLR